MNPDVRGPARLPFPPFRDRFPWIGGDLQTVRNTLRWSDPNLAPATRLKLPLADGDQLWASVNVPGHTTAKPTIVLIHGLTGDENSRNIKTSAAYHLGRGFPVIRMNLRGAGPSLGSSHGHYHAGRSQDLHEALAALPSAFKEHGALLVGASLGGNMLLKFMAEEPPPFVRAAAAVSPPVDLKAAQMCIMRPRNRLYHRHLLKQMKADAAGSGDVRITPELIEAIQSVYDFDDRIVAPTNGFADAEDYYARSSAGPRLSRIETPTLIVHAADDPWIPPDALSNAEFPNTGAVTLLMSPGGGHVGFHAADDPAPYHDRCIGMFFDAVLSRPQAQASQ